MSKWSFTQFDPSFAERILALQPHNVQSSLRWFDFIRSYSAELDRSVTIKKEGTSVGFVCALQHKNLIQSLPYPASYAGPVIAEIFTKYEINEMLDALFEHYAAMADVFTICASPFYGSVRASADTFDFESKGQVQYIDLTQPLLDGTDSKFRNNLKRNLRRAEESGVRIEESHTLDVLRQWYKCYEKRLTELGGTILPFDYFQQLFYALYPDGYSNLISATVDGKYVGGIITVQNEHCIDYYLSMFDREHDDSQASTAAFYYMLQRAKESGATILNLQSSPRSQTDLIKFKSSWGAREAEHRYLVKILNNREQLLQMSAEDIQRDFQFHFLLPFSALQKALQPA